MPNPSDYDNEDDWMSACVPTMVDEGRDQDQAVAACLNMWRERDKAAPSVLVHYDLRGTEPFQTRMRWPVIDRAYSVLTVKSFDNEKRELEGVATTPTVDRVGDIVEPMGAKFAVPMPLLWQHKHDQPVGHVIDARATKNGINVKAKLAKEEEPGLLKDLLDLAWQSVKAGLVRGLSIGFSPKEYEPLDEKNPFGGLRYTGWEWHELSLVTIPANAEATIGLIKSLDHGAPPTEPVSIKLPPKLPVKYSITPVKDVRQQYLTESEIAYLQRAGAKNIKKQWASLLYRNGEPLFLVSYSD